jgi:hypothetical protein
MWAFSDIVLYYKENIKIQLFDCFTNTSKFFRAILVVGRINLAAAKWS